MTTRTVQFWGQGYSTPPAAGFTLTPCTVTATFNGNTVFSGTIPTLESSNIERLPDQQVLLFSCDIPLNTTSTEYVEMVCNLTGDIVFLEQVYLNYCTVAPAGPPNGTSSGPDGFLPTGTDPRSNVTVTGGTTNTPPDPRVPPAVGAWGYEIDVDSGGSAVFSCTLEIPAGSDVPVFTP
jgi:hypothetical protein